MVLAQAIVPELALPVWRPPHLQLAFPQAAQDLVRKWRLSALEGEASGCGVTKMGTTAKACISSSNRAPKSTQ